jgi:predicted enzyme related to lactoylglutathione lyase
MLASSSVTLPWAERRSLRVVSSANQRSTRLIHDALVGVKCSWNRGWASSHRRQTPVAAWRAVVWCHLARSPSWQNIGMERVLGIGGYFMRAADSAALSAWYRDCLGMDADENGVWRQGAGLTVFATFESETDYFGSRAQQTMLNFRVRDLDAMLAQLRAKGADVAKEVQEMEGVGRFGWVTDPEGNRVELWQPA